MYFYSSSSNKPGCRQIGGLSTPYHPDPNTALVFIYDGFPGGVGIAEKGFDLLGDLWRTTYDAVRDCPCEYGRSSCIQISKNNRQTPEHKGVVLTGRLVLGRWDGRGWL